ncbi:hypothetical protein BX616_003283 [Lobosporangium transversale]|uniref:BTB domain-containing protein n=1 Tax=Lobosporangium transversale TaxID=64571 RepID=A0A1Y2GGX5_9FUNG|nr:hypothetical protein BCR41DRAFT_373104 [Lobosporangium transversale]KAF9899098.1 hypothetical protein BX616_003283 [Lobosporangium transversale]ORZ08808.1 hypothetical protein BCR41DRAFT_373104 [Lobosporangium transversale]|eukprot:XP_021878591.1 hypothetical protein BCR41DRAFT_373104 [Lobosporangium transversale]
MNTGTATGSNEVRVNIKAPPLADPPDNVSTVYDASRFTVTLRRQGGTLAVSIISNSNEWDGNTTYVHKYMHLVPFANPCGYTTIASKTELINSAESATGTIDITKVLHDGMYRFDIVFSTDPKPLMPLKIRCKAHDMMLTFMKDNESANVCFVFETDKNFTKVGLMAHRAVLIKYSKFAELLQSVAAKDTAPPNVVPPASAPSAPGAAISVIREDGGYRALMTISMTECSLAAFSAIVRYIYTGDVQLSVDLSSHAMCISKVVEGQHGLKSLPPGSLCWSPLDTGSPWKLKDVTWEELMLAANLYGITDLQAQCEQAVIKRTKASDAVKTLFEFGSSSDGVREAMLTMIADNMDTLIKDKKDPFELFKTHPSCHDFIMEVMRRRVARA